MKKPIKNELAALAGRMRGLADDMNSSLVKTPATPQQRSAVKGANLATACGHIFAKLADGKPVMLPGVGRLTVIERTVRGVRRSHVKFEAATALRNAISGQKQGVK